MQPLEDESSAGHEHQIGEVIKMQENNLHKLKIEKLLCHGKNELCFTVGICQISCDFYLFSHLI